MVLSFYLLYETNQKKFHSFAIIFFEGGDNE
jgi:hypothetical protein